VPITAKLVANMIVEAGADRVLTMDLHAYQIQGFFDIPVDHLYAAPVLNDYIHNLQLDRDDFIVVSPDEGSIKRAIGHSKRLGGAVAIIDKRRSSATETKQETLIGGPVTGKVALMFDDLISTGSSICGAAKLLKALGAREVHVAATHGVLCGNAMQNIERSDIATVAITNSIPLAQEKASSKIRVLTVAPLLAEAIKRIHQDQSVSDMFR
jgi:ribose-phosphate pyrophosphokinase